MYSEIYFMVPLILLIALTLDIVIGWPEKIYENIGHPVTWIGKVISYFEHSLNKREYSKKSLKLLGTLTFFLTVFPITAIAFLIEQMLLNFYYGFVIQALLIWPFLATKSLYTHVKDVADVTKELTTNFGLSRDEALGLSVNIIDTSRALGLSNSEGTKLIGSLTQNLLKVKQM